MTGSLLVPNHCDRYGSANILNRRITTDSIQNYSMDWSTGQPPIDQIPHLEYYGVPGSHWMFLMFLLNLRLRGITLLVVRRRLPCSSAIATTKMVALTTP